MKKTTTRRVNKGARRTAARIQKVRKAQVRVKGNLRKKRNGRLGP